MGISVQKWFPLETQSHMIYAFLGEPFGGSFVGLGVPSCFLSGRFGVPLPHPREFRIYVHFPGGWESFLWSFRQGRLAVSAVRDSGGSLGS